MNHHSALLLFFSDNNSRGIRRDYSGIRVGDDGGNV